MIVGRGLFHVFIAAERPMFVDLLRSVLPHGGRCCMLFSVTGSPGLTFPGVSRKEIRTAFREGGGLIRFRKPALKPILTRTAPASVFYPLKESDDVGGW